MKRVCLAVSVCLVLFGTFSTMGASDKPALLFLKSLLEDQRSSKRTTSPQKLEQSPANPEQEPFKFQDMGAKIKSAYAKSILVTAGSAEFILCLSKS